MTAFLKRAVSGLTALCLCAALCTGCAGTTTPGTAEIDYIVHGTAENDVSRTEYRRMAENAELALYVNPDTTAFRVEVKEDDTSGLPPMRRSRSCFHSPFRRRTERCAPFRPMRMP